MKHCILFALALSTCLMSGTVVARDINLIAENIIIGVCEDTWPPYHYYKRKNNKETGEITGVSVDIIREIFAKHNIRFTIELMPWKRCQENVRYGDEYLILLSASRTPEREKNYYLSKSYYQTHYHYFWSKEHHPDGLKIKDQTDLNNYKIGGIVGFAYSKLTKVDKSKIDPGANDLPGLIKKLHLARFDVFTESYEVLIGYHKIGKYDLDKDKYLASAPLPGIEKNEYHMLFTKNPVGLSLQKLIDQELTLMEQSGKLNNILRKYIKQ